MAEIDCETWETGKKFLGIPSKFVVVNEDGENIGTLADLLLVLMYAANNLSDLANKEEARSNLDVYSKLQTDQAISGIAPPNATETIAGIARIATQSETNTGANNTLIITPKKLLDGLKNHLNAIGNTPMYAIRSWVNFDGTDTININGSGNISSITDNGVGDYTLNFIVAQNHNRYAITSLPVEDASGYPIAPALRMSGTAPLLKTVSAARISTRSLYTGALFDINNISLQVLF